MRLQVPEVRGSRAFQLTLQRVEMAPRHQQKNLARSLVALEVVLEVGGVERGGEDGHRGQGSVGIEDVAHGLAPLLLGDGAVEAAPGTEVEEQQRTEQGPGEGSRAPGRQAGHRSRHQL
jgi:hypothetical protein